jgi:mRNA-degrading endonuclease RelE of RelBE toxin-antitoxin system
MNVNRNVIFREQFLDELLEIQAYLEGESLGRGKKFISRIYDFMMDTIERMPFMFQEYPYKLTDDKIYRRAIFESQYVVIYKVLDDAIVILKIHHTSKNPDNIQID